MHVAVDFGTTYTKIAYIDEQDRLQLFRYPAPAGPEYVPTALAYRRNRSRSAPSIGQAARNLVLHEPDVVYCENFKMLLPLEQPTQWAAQGWTAEAEPALIARDYFQMLLRDDAHAFERQVGRISGLVVSVPEVWQQTPDNCGAEAVRRIFRDDLGMPLKHLQSEPICAAAYYAYRYQQAERRDQPPFDGNLLMCDVGGGTFDVALCRVEQNRIEVLDFDGNGERELGLAGVTFDRNAMRLAWREYHQGEPELASVEFIEALRAFEQVKIDQASELEELLQLQRESGDEFIKDAPLYNFLRRYKLTYAQIEMAFEPIRQGISTVLGRIMQRARERNHSIDRIAIVGGFGQFPLVQEAILTALGITEPDMDVRFDPMMHGQREARQRAFAIAYGAALIASEKIETVEYYPHTLGIHGRSEYTGREDTLPIIEAGKVTSGRGQVVYAIGRNGQRQVFGIRGVTRSTLPIRLQVRGRGRWKVIKTPVNQFPPPGDYHIGLKIDRSNLASLIFYPLGGQGGELIYNLGLLAFEG